MLHGRNREVCKTAHDQTSIRAAATLAGSSDHEMFLPSLSHGIAYTKRSLLQPIIQQLQRRWKRSVATAMLFNVLTVC